MNTVAQTFEALVAAVRHCPEDEQAEFHAVNLVSYLAAMPERKACVALVCAKNFARFAGLERAVFVLELYGVQLLKKWHPKGGAFFVFAEIIGEGPDPFAGAGVIVLEPLQELKTLTHELAHALMHREVTPVTMKRHLCELKAESCVFLVCHSLGLDTSRYSFAYLVNWADDPAELLPAAEKASRTADAIVETLRGLFSSNPQGQPLPNAQLRSQPFLMAR